MAQEVRAESKCIEERRRELKEAIRAIVVTRERTPRNPRWAEAWRRNLFRYVRELQRLGPGPGAKCCMGDGEPGGRT